MWFLRDFNFTHCLHYLYVIVISRELFGQLSNFRVDVFLFIVHLPLHVSGSEIELIETNRINKTKKDVGDMGWCGLGRLITCLVSCLLEAPKNLLALSHCVYCASAFAAIEPFLYWMRWAIFRYTHHQPHYTCFCFLLYFCCCFFCRIRFLLLDSLFM